MKHQFLWGGGIGGIAGGAVVWLTQSSSFRLTPGEMSYEQLAAVLLTGSSVLMTLIGIFVAVLALWGYGHFKTLAESAAQAAAIAKIEAELKDGEIKRQIEQVVVGFIEEGLRNGTLRGLLEARASERKVLNDLDEEWKNAEVGDAK